MDQETRELIQRLHEKLETDNSETGKSSAGGTSRYVKIFFMFPYSQKIPDYFESSVREVLGKYTPKENILVSRDQPQYGIKIEHILELVQQADIGVALINPKNFNVFLEIGAMWGVQKECILLYWTDGGDPSEIPFDASSHLVASFSTKEELIEEIEKILRKIVLERKFIIDLGTFTTEQISEVVAQSSFEDLKSRFPAVMLSLTKPDSQTAEQENSRYFLLTVLAKSSGTTKDYFSKIIIEKTISEPDRDIKKKYLEIAEGAKSLLSENQIARICEYLLDEYQRDTDFYAQKNDLIQLQKFGGHMSPIHFNTLANSMIKKREKGYYGWQAFDVGLRILNGQQSNLSEENLAVYKPK